MIGAISRRPRVRAVPGWAKGGRRSPAAQSSTQGMLAQIRGQLHELGAARMALPPYQTEAVGAQARARQEPHETPLRQVAFHEIAREHRHPTAPVEQAAPNV